MKIRSVHMSGQDAKVTRVGKIGEDSQVVVRVDFSNLTQMLELQDEVSRAIRDTISEIID